MLLRFVGVQVLLTIGLCGVTLLIFWFFGVLFVPLGCFGANQDSFVLEFQLECLGFCLLGVSGSLCLKHCLLFLVQIRLLGVPFKPRELIRIRKADVINDHFCNKQN